MIPQYYEMIDIVFTFFFSFWMSLGWVSLFIWLVFKYVTWKSNKISREARHG